MNIDHCKTFTGLGDYLKEQAARTDLKQAECKQLYGTLEERCQHHYLNGLLSEYRNWYICEGASAVYTYLYRNWSYQSSLKANRGYLLEIADHLQQDYFCCRWSTDHSTGDHAHFILMTFPKRCWAVRFCICCCRTMPTEPMMPFAARIPHRMDSGPAISSCPIFSETLKQTLAPYYSMNWAICSISS